MPDFKKNFLHHLYSCSQQGNHKAYCFCGLKLKVRNIKPVKKTRLISYKNVPNRFEMPVFEKPLVSIIIPAYNQYNYTKTCLWSILQNTTISYEIILADDNSDDKTKDIKDFIGNLNVVRNKQNLGFLKNCNNAAKSAKGKYILFLNNDTQVTANWLDSLVETIEKDSTIGLVGSKFIYPDGSLQEAGGIIFKDASTSGYGRNEKNIYDNKYNYIKDVDYISDACVMLLKSLWDEIGGFDERYSPAYYEDTDLSMTIRYQKGLRVVYQPLSVVIHFEGKSCGTDFNSGIKKYQMINKEKFFQKWHNELEAFHSKNETDVFLARDHGLKKPVMLVIDYKILSFSKDTGCRSTYHYLHFFKRCGFNVKLFPHSYGIEDDFLASHLNDGFEVIHSDFWQWIKENGQHIDYVYLNRPNIAPYYIDHLRRYTNAKIIYQGHDLHYLRQYRQRLLDGDKNAEELLKKEKAAEFDVFRKVDNICFFSQFEIDTILQEDSSINAFAIPLYMLDDDKYKSIKYNPEERKDLIFVAGFGHAPNIDAAVWFTKEIFPIIKKQIPDIKFYIVGSNPTKKVLDLQSDDVIVTGYVSDEKLSELYSQMRLVVVPLRYGAGVKGKILEAIYNQVPVITTSIGEEGICNDTNVMIVANEADDFAKKVIEAYFDYDKLKVQSQKSNDFINKYYSFATIKQALSPMIKFNKIQHPSYYIVSGGFDPIHEGHIEMIKASAAESDGVIVLLNSDDWLCRKKGKNFMNFKTRQVICENLNGVKEVFAFDDSDNSACDGIRLARQKYPHAHLFFANGGDRTKDNIPEDATAKECNVELIFGVGGENKANSSSWILEKWQNKNAS